MADELQPKVDEAFASASRRYDIDERWLRAIAQTESGGDTGAKSPAGAIGLMQLMPDTARRLAVNPRDPIESIYGAARLLDENLRRYGDPHRAMAAYNAGTDERRWSNPETRAYGGKVMSNMAAISAKQDAHKKAATLDDSVYGWDEGDGRKTTTLGDDIYGWAPEGRLETKVPEQSRLEKAATIANDTVNAAGREIDRTGAGVARLLDYLSSAGHRIDNPLSRTASRVADKIEAAENADEASRADDYGGGLSDTVGTIGGGLLAAGLGGRVIRPAATLLEGSRAGRIAANVLKGEGNSATRWANNALAGGTQAALDGGDDPFHAAAVSLGLGAAGHLVGKSLVPVGGRVKNSFARALNYLDPEGVKTETAPRSAPESASGPMGDSSDAPKAAPGTPGVQPQTAAEQKAEERAQTKAVSKIGAFTDPKAAAQAIVSAFSGTKGTRLYEAQIPGVLHTQATKTRDVKLAALEDNLRDLYPDAFRTLDLANSDAYAAHLRGTIGTPEQIQNLERERTAFERESREAAFADEQAVPTGELHAILDRHIGDSRGNDAVKTALTRAKAALADASDEGGTALPSNLWNVRKAIGYGLQQAAASESSHMRAAASRLSPFMDDLAEHIDQGAPGFRDYLEGYSKRSSDIDSMRFLQSRGLTQASNDAANGEVVNYTALKRLIGQIDKNEVSVASKGTDAVTPQQEGRLRALYRDMLAEREIQAAGRSSSASKTFKAGMTQRTKEARGGHVGGLLGPIGGVLAGHEGGLLTGGAVGTALHTGNALLGHALAARRLTNMERTDQEVINHLLGR
ncbi:hypothetical protein AA103196_3097 [Ameyamaea chiangmaiensis NBRC 103196]|uniref:lytic transglycosylase domain-containing protein n=1 Tax=Ameyamaea chiangmaiensis TaxID=442969 RepID=UPI002156B4B2|nr:hypothetical protein AA103196_3097 [Ameyamaea chiangmaiensis NBRC 103196]